MLVIIQPIETKDYIVIEQNGNKVFGPNKFGSCAMFIKERAKEQGFYYTMHDAKGHMNG